MQSVIQCYLLSLQVHQNQQIVVSKPWLCGSVNLTAKENIHHEEERTSFFCCSARFRWSRHQPGYIQGGQEVGRDYLLLGIHVRRIPERHKSEYSHACRGIFLCFYFVPYKVNIPMHAGGFKQVIYKEYICWIQVKIYISDQTSLRICNSAAGFLTDI